MSNRHFAHAALLLNAAIWGAALPLVKPALAEVTPFQYLFYRYLLAVIFSLPVIIYLIHRYRPRLKTLLTIVLMETLGVGLALSLLYFGLNHTSSLQASFLALTSPVFIVVGGILFLREKEERHEAVGLILAIIGALILTLSPILSGESVQFKLSSLSGNILVFGHNLSWAAYIFLAKKYYRSVPKLLIGFVSPLVGLIFFFILTLATLPHSPNLDLLGSFILPLSIGPVFWAALYMGLLGSIVAVPAYIYGNNAIEASEASLFAYLQPLITIPLATLWLHEQLTPMMITALVLTTLGVIIAEKRTKKVPH